MKWGAHGEFDVAIGRFYFNHDTGARCYQGGDNDLRLLGGSEEHWQRIKHQYVAGAGER